MEILIEFGQRRLRFNFSVLDGFGAFDCQYLIPARTTLVVLCQKRKHGFFFCDRPYFCDRFFNRRVSIVDLRQLRDWLARFRLIECFLRIKKNWEIVYAMTSFGEGWMESVSRSITDRSTPGACATTVSYFLSKDFKPVPKLPTIKRNAYPNMHRTSNFGFGAVPSTFT